MEYDVLTVTVQNVLKRMDESKQEEQDFAYTCLHLVDSIIESSQDPQITTKVRTKSMTFFKQNYSINSDIYIRNYLYFQAAKSSNLLLWLLKRIRSRNMTSVKIFAGELLSVLLQDSEENRKIVGEADGVDILLKQLANFKKKDPKDKDEVELMENLFNSLCQILQFTPNRKRFLDGEGLHLMNLMVKVLVMQKKINL